MNSVTGTLTGGPRAGLLVSVLLVLLPSYCDQLKVSESTAVLRPFLPSILDGLIHLAAQFSAEVLNLVMETLCVVCTVDPEFTASVESRVCPFTIAVFLKHSSGTRAGPCGRPLSLMGCASGQRWTLSQREAAGVWVRRQRAWACDSRSLGAGGKNRQRSGSLSR